MRYMSKDTVNNITYNIEIVQLLEQFLEFVRLKTWMWFFEQSLNRWSSILEMTAKAVLL